LSFNNWKITEKDRPVVRHNNLKGAGPGRPIGSPNKLNKNIQECILEAFHSKEIGGVQGLIKWGKAMRNREAFYKLVSRIIPRQPVVSTDNRTQVNINLDEVIKEAEKIWDAN